MKRNRLPPPMEFIGGDVSGSLTTRQRIILMIFAVIVWGAIFVMAVHAIVSRTF